jgi:hypothetical protein
MNGYGARMKDTHFTNIVKLVEEEVGPLEKVYDAASSWTPEDEIKPVWLMLDKLVEPVTLETPIKRVRPIDRTVNDVPGVEFVPTYALALDEPIELKEGGQQYSIRVHLASLPWDQTLNETVTFPEVNIQGFVLAAPEGDTIVWVPGKINWTDNVTRHCTLVCHERNLIPGLEALNGQLEIDRGWLELNIWTVADTVRIKGILLSVCSKQA